MQDVVHRSAAGRGDDADALRQRGQRALTLSGKQAFRRQPGGQLLEAALQRAFTGVLHVIDDQLVLAPRLVESDACAH